MLVIYNKTDRALSIENNELPENGSLKIDIPYSSNLKMMEKSNIIAVVELENDILESTTIVETESETSADESETNGVIEKPKRKRTRKTNN